MTRETTLLGCYACGRGYPPAEMFFFAGFDLCPECTAELLTLALDDLSETRIAALLALVRARDREKP